MQVNVPETIARASLGGKAQHKWPIARRSCRHRVFLDFELVNQLPWAALVLRCPEHPAPQFSIGHLSQAPDRGPTIESEAALRRTVQLEAAFDWVHCDVVVSHHPPILKLAGEARIRLRGRGLVRPPLAVAHPPCAL